MTTSADKAVIPAGGATSPGPAGRSAVTRPAAGTRPHADACGPGTQQQRYARTGRRARPSPRRGLARLNPVAGFAYVAALAAAGLVLGNPLQLAVLFLLELAILVTAGRLRASLPYLMIALTTGLFLAVLNPLFSPAGLDVIWEADLGFMHLSVTIQGIAYGLGTALRLAVVVLAFALYTVVLDTDDQLELLSRLSFRSGLVVSLATRLFPVLSRDGRRIADAQRSRGVELDAGSRRDRVVARLPLLAALSTQSLERAMDVAESMEARGYGRPGRTFWHRDRRWRFVDVTSVVVGIVAVSALVVGLAGGLFRYRYYPLLDDPWPGLLDPVWLFTLACFVVPVVWLSLPRRRERTAAGASSAGRGSFAEGSP